MIEKIFYYFILFSIVSVDIIVIKKTLPYKTGKGDIKDILKVIFYNLATCFILPYLLFTFCSEAVIMNDEENEHKIVFSMAFSLGLLNLLYCVIKLTKKDNH